MTGTHYETLADAKAHGAALSYGNFINTLINFLIVAFAVFLLVRTINRLKNEQQPPPAPVEPPATEQLLTEIRDLLKSR